MIPYSGQRHIGSIMLAPQMLVPIGVFALLENGCTAVWLHRDGRLTGIEPSDTPEKIELWKRVHSKSLSRSFAYGGTASDRNVHQMTGRVT